MEVDFKEMQKLSFWKLRWQITGGSPKRRREDVLFPTVGKVELPTINNKPHTCCFCCCCSKIVNEGKLRRLEGGHRHGELLLRQGNCHRSHLSFSPRLTTENKNSIVQFFLDYLLSQNQIRHTISTSVLLIHTFVFKFKIKLPQKWKEAPGWPGSTTSLHLGDSLDFALDSASSLSLRFQSVSIFFLSFQF